MRAFSTWAVICLELLVRYLIVKVPIKLSWFVVDTWSSMISTSQTRWPWVYCPVASTRNSCGSAAFPWTGGICALGLEAPGLASNPTSELSDKVRLPAFLSLTPKFTFPPQDSPAEHPVFGKLSCGKPQVHVRPNNQPQTTTEISMFRIIFLSSLWSGVPALRPLLARVLGPLAGCISKRMVCFKLPLLDPLSLSQSMKSPRVDQLLIIPREATSTSTGTSILVSVVMCDTEGGEDWPVVWNILLELYLTLPASEKEDRREGSSKWRQWKCWEALCSFLTTRHVHWSYARQSLRLGWCCYGRG